ncbi:potassium transporter-domain-containing protein [Pseudomassariella vexata]|uniref:Potassium transporter-domain-containing protein n=1 Tax=Pseudomassariella vexata TaxID=1141098 RepID=A0A1Y2E3F4_9PEZI|nr:potassium transporter-domain-containing protein [Pseudomassariella vexata]ORY66088.1 potassium transporter-domain-containing protein [Pseudomassariella vexata]
MATPAVIIADEIQPVKRERLAGAGGVYNARSLSRSRVPGDGRSASRSSNERSEQTGDFEDGDGWQRDDGRKKQVFKGTTLLWLAYQSTGVIYGDIGTSPLYVYSSTFTEEPNYNDVLQVLSLIIWSLTIMVTLKYVGIVLRADNEGEGGTFSCYSLLTRYANITERDPREAQLIKMERHKTQDLHRPNQTIRSRIEKSKFTRGLLKVVGVLAVSMVMADGVLTPAQSVLGAVQGLIVVKPDISSQTVVGATCGILVALFLIQPLGTTKLANTFAPIVILWLAFNAAFGIYNLANFDHSVLKAFSPYYAIHFFMEKKTHGWRMLGGVLLAFTGVEALFADLGAFSMRAIQISWMCYCYPCLLLAYIGQAAYISAHPDAYSNPFFNSVPPGMLYPSLIVAVLAAIVASQAIITATFQLISQIMKLSYCPQVKIVHTSKTFHGQLYVPFLNWLLMLGTILVTCVYSNTTRLGNAYGVCVMFVTFFDTCMVTLVSLLVWRLSPFLVFIPWLFFATVDGLYLSSSLVKVPDGAWFTLTISGILACVFLLWRFGKENQWRAEAEDRFRPSSLITKDPDGKACLTERWGGGALSSIRGLGIYFDKTGVLTPTVFTQFVSKFGAIPEVMVFFHLHPVEAPSVAGDERYVISRLGAIPGCYRLTVRHGFMDEVISPDLAALIYAQVRKFIIRQAGGHPLPEDVDVDENNNVSLSTSFDRALKDRITLTASAKFSGDVDYTGYETGHSDAEKGNDHGPPELRDKVVRAELARLDRSYASKVMYVIGKEQMKIKPGTHIFRRIVLTTFLWIRENTRAKIANLRLAMDRVVEVGFVKDI